MGEWLSKHGQTIYGTRGGPIEQQIWGVATQNNQHIYLHILEPATPTEEGWLTLSGTSKLQADSCKLFDGSPVELRRDGNNDLEVRMAAIPDDVIDTILVLPVP